MENLGVEVSVNLSPHPANQDIHGIRLWIEIIAPNMFQESSLRDHFAGIEQKVLEQFELRYNNRTSLPGYETISGNTFFTALL